MWDVRSLGARTTPVPPPPDRQMWDSGMGPRLVRAVAPRSMFPLASTLEAAMSAPCASVFPPVKGVEESGDPPSPQGQAVGGGLRSQGQFCQQTVRHLA